MLIKKQALYRDPATGENYFVFIRKEKSRRSFIVRKQFSGSFRKYNLNKPGTKGYRAEDVLKNKSNFFHTLVKKPSDVITSFSASIFFSKR